jgi:tripartite-type tricarboxylate transporter receptor subunit TctC
MVALWRERRSNKYSIVVRAPRNRASRNDDEENMQARRSMAVSALGTLIACAGASLAHAQGYPAKPIRFVVGFTAGGASDITARIVGQKLTEHFGQPVVIDNRAGASGTIAGGIVAKAPPDGYTLLAGATSILAINPGLYPKLDYDPLRDFAPVSQTVSMPQLLVVHPSVKALTLKELLALARSKPGELNYSSSGTGSSSHLAMELLKYMTGVNVVHVPFKGSGQAMPSLLAGQVQLVFDPIPTSLPHVKSGRLRAIAISTAARSRAIPDLPTVAEAGVPGYESSLWYGVLLPVRTPPAIIARLNETINAILCEADVNERFAALGAEPLGGSPADFGKYIRTEVIKWGKVIKTVGIRAD